MGKIIELNHITKIEGHASLSLGLDGTTVTKCELQAEEGARYFEGLVVDRHYREASEITSRICGICSCAHTICAIQACEAALGIEPSEQTYKLRELLTYAERIRSHTTHLYFLALPDYLGFESALAMAPTHKATLQQALRLMKLGNDLIFLIGGRDLHPASATVGGWLKLPPVQELRTIARRLREALPDAEQTANLFARLKQPSFQRPTEYFSLTRPGEYATLRGDLTSQSSRFPKERYHEFLHEYHERYATSNFVVKEGKSYLVGALSRLNNNHQWLSPAAQRVVARHSITFPLHGPFLNNLAQAIELVHYVEKAAELCETLTPKKEPLIEAQPRSGVGIGAIEVPRGVLWHEYELDKTGTIIRANIITPTCQNLRNCEDDIKAFVPTIAHLPKEALVTEIEKLIRSYDPCFSCSTHFLKVKWFSK
ncbi:Ni/Fe hydrogenase subunit alpha [Candidatus Woesearchaeota archaeon]|nr:MAG: Ni/Fe hydrogenase subunit alpha [Candidatus Woesearchaeota archaeon]